MKQPVKFQNYLENIRHTQLADLLSAKTKQLKLYQMINTMIALEIPYKNDPEKGGLIFWFKPSEKLLEALPERISKNLRQEFKLFESSEAKCGAHIDKETAYLDIWRACDGAIENLRMFPNPVKDLASVKFELKENRTLSFAVFNREGAKIMDLPEPTMMNKGSRNLNFDLSSLNEGMYFLVVLSNIGEKAMQKFIKLK